MYKRSCRLLLADIFPISGGASSREAAAADPSASLKLVDRLKDMKLQGYWIGAIKLFNNSTKHGRTSRWQAFHYGILTELLIDGRQYDQLERVWNHMKEHHFLAVDEDSANAFLSRLGQAKRGGQGASRRLLEVTRDVMTFMEEQKMKLNARGARSAVSVFAKDGAWEKALELIVQHPPHLPKGVVPSGKVLDGGLSIQHVDTALRGMRDPEAVASCMRAVRDAGLEPTSETWAAFVDAFRVEQWEEGLKVFHVALAHHRQETAKSSQDDTTTARSAAAPPSPRLFNAAILLAVRAKKESAIVESLYEEMRKAKTAPNSFTMETMMTHYERTGQWKKVLSTYESFHKEHPSLSGTNNSYSSVVKALSRAGMPTEIMTLFEEMRGKGFAGNASADVALINAWSSQRRRRHY